MKSRIRASDHLCPWAWQQLHDLVAARSPTFRIATPASPFLIAAICRRERDRVQIRTNSLGISPPVMEHLKLPDVRRAAHKSMGGLTSIEYILTHPQHKVRAPVLASTSGSINMPPSPWLTHSAFPNGNAKQQPRARDNASPRNFASSGRAHGEGTARAPLPLPGDLQHQRRFLRSGGAAQAQ